VKVYRLDALGTGYADLLRDVEQSGDIVRPRGMEVREVRPLVLEILDPTRSLVKRPGINRALMWMEIAQLIAGEWDEGLMRAMSAQAAVLMSAQGAYGPRTAMQLEQAVLELVHDADSRRATVIVARESDLLKARAGANEQPCTLSWQVFARGGRLEMVVSMRSWDLVWGLANDVPMFTMIQRCLAWALGLEVGTYTHVAGSGHVYSRHYGLWERVSPTTERLALVIPRDLPSGFMAQDRWVGVVAGAISALRLARVGKLDELPAHWSHVAPLWKKKLENHG
jgi:hypothetical protein